MIELRASKQTYWEYAQEHQIPYPELDCAKLRERYNYKTGDREMYSCNTEPRKCKYCCEMLLFDSKVHHWSSYHDPQCNCEECDSPCALVKRSIEEDVL